MKNQAISFLIFCAMGLAHAKPAEKIATPADAQAAQKSFAEMLRAYEAGNIVMLRKNFDPSMIGLQRTLDSIASETARCKQMRIDLHDTKTSVGPDLAVIQTDWEKRCLLLPNMTATFSSGQSTFLMHRDLSGWKTTGISGSNPFESTNAPATMTASTTLTCAAVNALSVPVSMSFQITVVDTNRTSATSINVKVSSGTDVETISVPAAAGQPGVLKTTTLMIGKGSGTSGNGAVEILVTGSTCSRVNLSYVSNSATSGVQSANASVAIP